MSKRTAKWLIIPALIIVLLAGCSTEQPSPSPSIDPPPEGAWEDVLDEQWEMDEIDEAAEKGAYAPVTLYYKDEYGHVAPVTMRIPMTPEIAQRALEYMIDGNTSSKELPAGFTRLIPAGTTVLGMQIVEDEKLAIVDFSPEFASYDAKDERKIVEAITWALTSFPTIDKVKLWINGVPLHEMPVNGLPLQEPLTRSFGINLEAPCSMKTLAGIAMGYDDSLLVRAADVMLKERRRLILLTRETPLNLSHIRNMETVTLMGGIILPPVPAFYSRPQTVDDIVDQTVSRTLRLLGLDGGERFRWNGNG